MYSPVVEMAKNNCCTVADGTACLRMATVPAMCAAAIDVPLRAAYKPLGSDDTIPSPGAPIGVFRRLENTLT